MKAAETISSYSSVEVDEHALSSGSELELLFENHDDRKNYRNSADVASSEEEGAANTVGNLAPVHSSTDEQSKLTLKREITPFSGVFVVINQF